MNTEHEHAEKIGQSAIDAAHKLRNVRVEIVHHTGQTKWFWTNGITVRSGFSREDDAWLDVARHYKIGGFAIPAPPSDYDLAPLSAAEAIFHSLTGGINPTLEAAARRALGPDPSDMDSGVNAGGYRSDTRVFGRKAPPSRPPTSDERLADVRAARAKAAADERDARIFLIGMAIGATLTTIVWIIVTR